MLSSRLSAVVVGAAALSILVPATGQASVDHAAATHKPATHKSTDHKSVSHKAMSRTLARDLAKLRSCESGGNWHADTGNGYYGAYQFAEGTWHGLGYSGRPDEASPSVQNAATLKLHARSGWHPWPACAQREGLYNS